MGLVATALAELADDRIFDGSDLKELVPVSVLTEISYPLHWKPFIASTGP